MARVRKIIRIRRRVKKADKVEKGNTYKKCPTCNGSGKVKK